MQSFISKQTDKIRATLSCFDRIIFKGHLPICYPEAIESFLARQDVLFINHSSLQSLYPRLLGYATLSLGAEDVLTFLGRKLHGLFKGEILNDFKKRWPGARVKHRMKENWIKMYDKHGVVLRIETVINHPTEFKVYRQGKRNGEKVLGWFPMAKGVSNMRRYTKVCRMANRRYLEALSVVDDPATAIRLSTRPPVQSASKVALTGDSILSTEKTCLSSIPSFEVSTPSTALEMQTYASDSSTNRVMQRPLVVKALEFLASLKDFMSTASSPRFPDLVAGVSAKSVVL